MENASGSASVVCASLIFLVDVKIHVEAWKQEHPDVPNQVVQSPRAANIPLVEHVEPGSETSEHREGQPDAPPVQDEILGIAAEDQPVSNDGPGNDQLPDQAQQPPAINAEPLPTLSPETGPNAALIQSIDWSLDDTRIFTTSSDFILRCYCSKSGSLLATLTHHTNDVFIMLTHPKLDHILATGIIWITRSKLRWYPGAVEY